MVRTLANSTCSSLRARTDSLKCSAFVYHDGLYDDITVIQFFGFILVFGLPVSDRAAEQCLKNL